MDRIGGAEQFEHGPRRDPARLLVFDHGRADHEAPVAARHDIDRMARMQEPHRPAKARSRVSARTSISPLTPRRSGQRVLRREAAAIDRPIGIVRARRGIRAKTQRDSVKGREPRGERRHRRAGIEMRFVRRNTTPRSKRPSRSGSSAASAAASRHSKPRGAAGKTGKLRPVARRSRATSDPRCALRPARSGPEVQAIRGRDRE